MRPDARRRVLAIALVAAASLGAFVDGVSQGDAGWATRAEGELDDLRENSDCLKKFRERMQETGEVSMEELDAIDAEVMDLIERSVTEAKAAARPTAEQVTDDVYINYSASA